MGVLSDLLGTLRNTFRINRATLDASGLTAARTISLPDASGQVLLDWDRTTTATSKTLVDREWLNVTAAGQTITLPTHSPGRRVMISVAGFSDIIIDRNGASIDGVADDRRINAEYVTVGYIADATMWRRVV